MISDGHVQNTASENFYESYIFNHCFRACFKMTKALLLHIVKKLGGCSSLHSFVPPTKSATKKSLNIVGSDPSSSPAASGAFSVPSLYSLVL